ncbi:MAG: hypothetical protein ACKOW9_00850 [Candidatus Paceibacterota bacterium]
MKGTKWNGDYFATKGCTRSDGSHMFSVGNLVAFEVTTFSSPDGRRYSYGCIPSQNNYLLQEEIVLGEHDNTESNRYGSGSYDIKKIVELKDAFWHERSTQLIYKTFLLQILESNENVFVGGFISGDIAEVRNHPGKFLHIYEIPEGYRGCKAESFTETVEKISLQKKQEDEAAAEAVNRDFWGVELSFGITTHGGWYKPSINFGTYEITPQHEHDSSGTTLGKIKIMPCVPEGAHQIYIWGYPVSLYIKKGEQPYISMCASSSFGNSQSWWYDSHYSTSIEKGWIFVDGEDIFQPTRDNVQKNVAERAAKRKASFETLSVEITEKYGDEVFKAVLRKKGKVLRVLSALKNMVDPTGVAKPDILKAISLTDDGSEIANLINFVKSGVNPSKAAKVAEKAGAWKYLMDVFPGVKFEGRFDEAAAALAIYGKNW